jgi:hypothetical protein
MDIILKKTQKKLIYRSEAISGGLFDFRSLRSSSHALILKNRASDKQGDFGYSLIFVIFKSYDQLI